MKTKNNITLECPICKERFELRKIVTFINDILHKTEKDDLCKITDNAEEFWKEVDKSYIPGRSSVYNFDTQHEDPKPIE